MKIDRNKNRSIYFLMSKLYNNYMKIYIVTYNTKLSSEAYTKLENAQRFIMNREGMEGLVKTPEEVQFRIEDRNGGIFQIWEVVTND